ncbi:MAG: hypothetical protein AB7F40_09140 [Victivallaceae bacterium]
MTRLLTFILALAGLTAAFHASGSESPERVRANALRQLKKADQQLQPKLYDSLINAAKKQDKLQKQLDYLSRNPPRQSSGNTQVQYEKKLENYRQSLEQSKSVCDNMAGSMNNLAGDVSGSLSTLTQQDSSETSLLTARADSLCTYTLTENASPGYRMVEMIKYAKQIEQCINNINSNINGIRQRASIYARNRQKFAVIGKRYSRDNGGKRASGNANYNSACSTIQTHISSLLSSYDSAISSGNGMINQLAQARGRLGEKLAALRKAMQTPMPATP